METPPQIDGQAMLAEAWRDIFAAKIGLAQMLTLRVIFRYSFALNRAAAWIPHLGVFEYHTKMGKKEIGDAIEQLVSYQMLQWKEAPLLNVLSHGQYQDGRIYMYFPRSVQSWSISARIPDRRLLERAASLDRWLPAFNAGGGPETSDLFPELWTHADTLAEWKRSDEPALLCPGILATQSAQPPTFVRSTGHSPAAAPVRPDPGDETVGKFPTTPRGEIPHDPPLNDWNELNERHVSHLIHSNPFNARGVGKNPKPSTEADERAAHWPPLEKERAMMRQLNVLIDRYYTAEMAAWVKAEYGGQWRNRIRKFPFGVEQAMLLATAQWAEMTDLGTFLNMHWKRLHKAHLARLASTPAAEPEPLDAATVRARIEESLLEGKSAYVGVPTEGSEG